MQFMEGYTGIDTSVVSLVCGKGRQNCGAPRVSRNAWAANIAQSLNGFPIIMCIGKTNAAITRERKLVFVSLRSYKNYYQRGGTCYKWEWQWERQWNPA